MSLAGLSAGSATEFAASLLQAAAVPEAASRLTAASLVSADQQGTGSHGLMLLPLYLDRLAGGSIAPRAEGRIVSDSAGAVVMDAENALGPVAASQAVGLAVERARQHGLGAVALRNGFHFGRAGEWAAAIASQGCIGIVLSNTRPLMPAPGGAERVVGNNPIAVALPLAGEAPLVLDLASSAGAMGKIRLAEASGQAIPDGWAADAAGTPTTDPAAAIKGMLLPAGGPKGFGLAIMADLIAGGLSGGAIGSAVAPLYGDPTVPYRCSQFFLAIDIGHFRDPGLFGTDAAGSAAAVRGSRPAKGAESPRMPGDRAVAARAANSDFCPLAPATLKMLAAAAGRLGVALPADYPA